MSSAKNGSSIFDKIRGLKGSKETFFLFAITMIVVVFFVYILIDIAYNSLDALKEVGIINFITGDLWRPSLDSYGASSLIIGTFFVTAGAMLFSIPVGIGTAIYLNDIASPRIRSILKPACELLAGIPSVVYGFLGMLIFIPMILELFPDQVMYNTSWLAASLVLGIMALPTIISVTQDSLAAVPKSYTEASMALGATRWETTRKVVMRSAISGICAASILGIGRALGETMAVIMVAGNSPIIPEPLWNIFSNIRTMTASIAIEMPEITYGSLHFSALFLLGLVLMAIALAVNLFARMIVVKTNKRMHVGEGHPLFERCFPIAMKCTFIGTVFFLTYALSSLFIDNAVSLAVGVLVAVFMMSMGRIGKLVGSRHVNTTVYVILRGVVLSVMILLTVMIGAIVIKGLPALSFDFIFSSPSNGGRSGGIWPAIVGSLQLMAGTAAIAFPLGVISGIYLALYAKNGKFTNSIRQTIYAVNGMPSIVFGLFGMSLFVLTFGWGYSMIGGSLTLALMVLPTIIKTTEEAVSAVPKELNEAALALGSSTWQSTSKVVLPAAMGGVLTGMILSLGRAIGETAPIMFTAAVAYKRVAGIDLFEPVMALPYHLYYLAMEVPGTEINQYGTALVLLIVVMIMFLTVSLVRHHYAKKLG